MAFSSAVILVLGLSIGIYAGFYTVSFGQDFGKPPNYAPVPVSITDEDQAIEKFAGFLRLETLSNDSAPNHIGPDRLPAFKQALDYMKTNWPEAFSSLKLDLVAGYTVLLTWQGTDPTLPPALFISHYDVVPAPPQGWTYPPFSGAREGGYIYGRGALDVKVSTTAALEAICQILRRDPSFRPQRTIYFTTGHDEEIGGIYGATGVAKLLKARGVKLGMVVDEGGAVMTEGIKGLIKDRPVALIGTAEKGFVRVEAAITGKRAGHASMPPRDGRQAATSTLHRLLSRMETSPPRAFLSHPMVEFFMRVSYYSHPILSPILRTAFVPYVANALAFVLGKASDESAALVRMTTAPTDIHGGIAYNVLMREIQLGVNCRVPPGRDHRDCVEYLGSLLDKEERDRVAFTVDQKSLGVASPVSSSEGWGFRLVERAILEAIAPQDVGSAVPVPLAVVPYLMLAGTDSKRFYDVIDWQTVGSGIYRFAPLFMGPGDMARIHSIDERISELNYVSAVKFYTRLLELTAEGRPAAGGSAAGKERSKGSVEL